ncbi:hypothetical protein M011DRAFT_475152 [Sporormia fimetaria CBS 119925]|uniref:ATP-dependent DNA helicase n=1 Tax=Sporormia fimetaria CBS 119925 TaxID=1340428 RepID=A0A6A6VGW0_9PLEO|nr:hypothetical protein M011DRAFT_475152 [Sporormia fimetaria CBS 119925]
MSSVAVAAEVQSVRPRGHVDTDLIQFDPSTFSSLFTDSAALAAEDGRARKRRKLANAATILTPDIDESKSAVLGQVILDLHVPPTTIPSEKGRVQIGDAPTKPLIVSLDAFEKLTTDSFSISLRNPYNAAPALDIVATTPTSTLTCLDQHFAPAVTLCNVMFSKSASSAKPKSGACFCQCTLAPPLDATKPWTLTVQIRWSYGIPVVEVLGTKTKYGRMDLEILSKYYPSDVGKTSTWSPSDFYDSVHVPSTELEVSSRIQHSLPETMLYPFQQRAVDWLLRREGVVYPKSGGELTEREVPSLTTPVSFRPAQDAQGTHIHVSHLRGLIVSDVEGIPDASRNLRGGILAEEMGLGKTVELIALMCHHKRTLPKLHSTVLDAYTGTWVRPTGATLIISPPSLIEQWNNEIENHAPQLKVTLYSGIPPSTASKREQSLATVDHLMHYDVVITTYKVLSREIHFAKPPPDRTMRNAKQYKQRKSPLVQISWWRVCLDEAQMIESGVSQAATVARLIPRCNAWAVTGTPLRKDVQDLRGFLTFLRYEPFAGHKAIWERLDKSSFRAIFNQIALRHTKDKIRNELKLPPQKRVVITVPFTVIEEQHYSELVRQMCEDCSLSPEGQPLQEGVSRDDPEVVDQMREWLVRLRQTCLHAQVGKRNRRALGGSLRDGPLRTVHDVLEVMIDQNDTSKKAEAREHILSLVRMGHITASAGDVEKRAEAALPFYKQALEQTQRWVAICRKDLLEEKEQLHRQEPELRRQKPEAEASEDEEEQDSEKQGRLSTIRKSLRSFLELEHTCKFFHGTVYYQIKSNEALTQPDSEEYHRLEKLEVEWYEQAKLIRKELLKDVQHKAQQQMRRIEAANPFHQLVHISDLPDMGGIEGKKILDMMDSICDLLNAQAKQIDKWRKKIVDILLLPLVDQDEEETTGEEYEQSTQAQDELYVYFMALRTLVAHRHAAVSGMRDTLLNYELEQAEDQAREKKGHAPGLVLEVAETCRKLKPQDEDVSLRGALAAARSVVTSVQWKANASDERAAIEVAIAQKQLSAIQKIATDEAKSVKELEREQDMFRATMNQRLEFYRQLQHISDSVAVEKEGLDRKFDVAGFEREQRKMERSMKRLEGYEGKHAYLVNLRQENEESAQYECIICKDDFEIGVLTSCGHKYCKECIAQWWKQNRNCPLCKTKLYPRDFTDINFKPGETKVRMEHHNVEEGPSQVPSTTSIYSDISDATMREIRMIDLNGSYGTKVDMIARHLLWIRKNDVGAKSIIFSQFSDFLGVLRQALEGWKVGCSSISDKDGIHNFKTDPTVECFLLDAKSDSSGLNLVNATYVFLCEPLINTALELQAIARVHRIGQRRPTSVFMYLVSDTVEEAIYDISVKRRLEHMGRKPRAGFDAESETPGLKEQALDAANSIELQAAPLQKLLRKKNEGEVVQADDMWTCLFGRPRKQLSAALNGEVDRHLRGQAAESRRAQEQAEAGPSA